MNLTDDFFYEASETEIFSNPASLAEALDHEVEKTTGAFSTMTAAVESEFATLLECIAGDQKGITHIFTDRNGTAHPARPCFFAEQWQDKERLIDSAWLAELRERADQTQQDLSDAEFELYRVLEDFEQQPTAAAIGELRAAQRVFEQQTDRAVSAQEMLLRAERALILIWARANYHRRPFQRCGGELPELVTLNMQELKA
ncbi:hypothetical protein EDF88_5003 [Buttiauxella sp. BIGb0552]|uniref:hypothetical protein n=1 Tax=Buttiauxella sp. BIGb0552 TaxID=2485120 RepID=UPI0010666354|nr:hypothetical protein [Buttiauxella sp. BIGb0552]TDX09588.1 hypothetical protein EDF88_5003 [Buttiauxella sp. BIGb0552]